VNNSGEEAMRSPRNSVREFLLDERWGCGLTQEELAERSGLSIRTISDIERGFVLRPRITTLRMLASGLEMNEARTREFLLMVRSTTEIES
jgi:transcriptional regulator with XRE-family HTH domain